MTFLFALAGKSPHIATVCRRSEQEKSIGDYMVIVMVI